jgi:DNA-binding NarL/FixJ family response regulator
MTGRAALELAARSHPDVVLMDIRMRTLDGLEATWRLPATAAPVPRVLILTTFDLDEYVYEAPRAGGSGSLLKSARPPELVAAVRAPPSPATPCSRRRSPAASSSPTSGGPRPGGTSHRSSSR